MPGLFNPPLVAINTSLIPEQRARAAALLVAQQARPVSSVTELIRLAEYLIIGVDTEQMDLPVQALPYNNEMGLRGGLIFDDEDGAERHG